jgi:hypothetical protein
VHKHRMANAQRDLKRVKRVVTLGQNDNSGRFAATADVRIVRRCFYTCDSNSALIVLLRTAYKCAWPSASLILVVPTGAVGHAARTLPLIIMEHSA